MSQAPPPPRQPARPHPEQPGEPAPAAQPTPSAQHDWGHIRSFGTRRGHLSEAQRLAHETLLPRYGVPAQPERIDAPTLFGRRAPLVLEIGFGMGHTSAEIAVQRADTDFIGVEVYTPGVGSLLRQIEARGLNNLRVIQQDAVEVLRDRIAPDALDGVHVYFPDPWPKARHHKRRLIQPPLVHLLAQRIAPDGYLHCATDWQPYAEQMLAVLQAEPLLVNTAGDYAPRPSWRPLTKFEHRGLRLGHGVWDLIFRKRPATP